MSEQSVLIVDDEPDIRELLDITLSRMGLETHSAATLEEARDMVTRIPLGGHFVRWHSMKQRAARPIGYFTTAGLIFSTRTLKSSLRLTFLTTINGCD